MIRISAVLFLSLVISAVKAQTLQSDTLAKTKTKVSGQRIFVNAGLQYISNLTYAGRKDLKTDPILLPTLTLISKSGFFLCGIGYGDISTDIKAEGFSITPGYVFTLDAKKQFSGALSATKYFITKASPVILSSFNASIDGQLSYNPGFVKLTLAGSYRIGRDNKNDIVTSAELSKEIQIIKVTGKDKIGFKINPTITAYGGTQSFYQTYYTESEVQRAVDNPSSSPFSLLRPGQSQQSYVNQTVTKQNQQQVLQYNLLALSSSMPLTVSVGKIQFSLTPYYISSYNVVSYGKTVSTGSFFLFTAGLSATF